MSGRRAYDNVLQAASGLADVQTNPAKGTPELFRTLVCDKTTAYTACQAITAALFARAMGKAEGQHIVLSMLDTAIAFLWPDSAMDVSLTDDDVDRAPTLASNYTAIPLADGYAAASAVSESEFAGLCATYGRPEIAEDPRFVGLASRSRHRKELSAVLREAAQSTTVEQITKGVVEHVVTGTNTTPLTDAHDDPHVINNTPLA